MKRLVLDKHDGKFAEYAAAPEWSDEIGIDLELINAIDNMGYEFIAFSSRRTVIVSNQHNQPGSWMYEIPIGV